MKDIVQKLVEFKNDIDTALQCRINILPENDIAQQRIKSAINHSLFGSAKRIRAFVVWQSCKNYGISLESVINVMVAVEYTHCYSLIHDDLPCMDNADERRGKLALHKEFDESTALLTGNSLVSLAFNEILDKNFDVENYIKLNLMYDLSKSIGFHGMMAGQMLDLMIVKSENSTTEEFIHMNKLKTGELFALCMSVGAILTQNNQNLQDMKQIGYDIGYIFQLVDDILDVEEDTGKNHSELLAKKTLIEHLGGVDEAKQHLYMIADQSKLRVNKLCKNTDIVELIDYITNQLSL